MVSMTYQSVMNETTESDAETEKQEITLLGGVSIIAGTIIGSGIFASPTIVVVMSGSVGMALVIWSLCGVISMGMALCYIELGTMIPESGGEYVYLRRAFGELPAFLFSYIECFMLKPGNFAIASLIIGQYLVEAFLGTSCSADQKQIIAKLIGAFCLGVITFINIISTRLATSVQVFFTAAKLLAIAILIITGLVSLVQGHNENFQNSFEGTSTSVSKIAYAFNGALWAYGGWNNLNLVTAELKNPTRNLPLAIVIGISLVTGCYILTNIAYLSVLTSAEIQTSKAVAVNLANRLFGPMAWIMPFLIACSAFGAANGTAFVAGRLLKETAKKGHTPIVLGMVHTKRYTPVPAIVFTCIVSWIMLIPKSSNFATLVNYFNFTAWFFYGATIAALLWLRYKEPDTKRPYKVNIIIPILTLLYSIYLIIAPFYDYPMESLYGLLFISTGIPIYYVCIKRQLLKDTCIEKTFSSLTRKLQHIGDLSLLREVEPIQYDDKI